jgi:hypothetical protein
MREREDYLRRPLGTGPSQLKRGWLTVAHLLHGNQTEIATVGRDPHSKERTSDA